MSQTPERFGLAPAAVRGAGRGRNFCAFAENVGEARGSSPSVLPLMVSMRLTLSCAAFRLRALPFC